MKLIPIRRPTGINSYKLQASSHQPRALRLADHSHLAHKQAESTTQRAKSKEHGAESKKKVMSNEYRVVSHEYQESSIKHPVSRTQSFNPSVLQPFSHRSLVIDYWIFKHLRTNSHKPQATSIEYQASSIDNQVSRFRKRTKPIISRDFYKFELQR